MANLRISAKRRLLLLTTLGILGLGALYAGAYLYVGEKIPRLATVNGVSIGGLDRPSAIAKLRKELALPPSITISAKSKSISIKPSDAGISYDYETTVDGFPARSADPLKLFGYLFSSRSNDLSTPIDQDALSAALDPLQRQVTKTPRDGGITFVNTTPVGVRPVDGTELDLKTLTSDLQQNLRIGKTDFVVGIVPRTSPVTWEQVQQVIADVAQPAVALPITIVVDGHAIEVSPTHIANSLKFTATADGRLEPGVITEQLKSDLGSAWSQWTIAPRSASFKSVSGRLQVIPSVVGRDVPDQKLSRAIVDVLTKTEDRVVNVSTEEVEPKLTTNAALGLNVNDRIGTFTTRFPWTWYRAHNIHRAADILNGTIVQAGGIFSLNQTLGQRTAANGFVEGVVISGGRLAKDFGGGVSQVSTTTYNAAWFAGLKILQHKPHSFYISRYPIGRESTLSWPDVDMRFQNDTDHPIVITTSYYSNVITVSIYGTRKYDVETITGPRTNPRGFKVIDDDSATCINQAGEGGFDIQVTRILKQGGIEVRREVYNTRYLAEARITCTNPDATFGNVRPPKPKPKPKPSASITPTPTPSP